MRDDALLAAPAVALARNEVSDFCDEYFLVGGQVRALAETKRGDWLEETVRCLERGFGRTIAAIRDHVRDSRIGVAALDVPSVYRDAGEDLVAGALFAVLLARAIAPLRPDSCNNTPFTLFAASTANDDLLDSAGMLHFSPSSVLDYHADGAIYGRRLTVPTYIFIYNIFINYKKKGNFYWVPSSAVPELPDHVARIGYEADYYFEITPSVYAAHDGSLAAPRGRYARTAIFREPDGAGDGAGIVTFMNGTLRGKRGDACAREKLRAFRAAIAGARKRYRVEQAPRRMIFLNNAAGFHARDVFQEPIRGFAQTRNYLRSISVEDVPMGEIVDSLPEWICR